MKAANLRDHTEEELRQMCREKRQALGELRINRMTGEATEQPLMMRAYRRDIARMLTVLKERESTDNG